MTSIHVEPNTMHINAKRVIETRIAESMGFNKYKQIMERVRNTNVSSDKDFQRTFNSYYRIRRNEEWQIIFYDLFETIKDSEPSFGQIIRVLYKNTGNIEASFSSKMLATINSDMPIWDRYVVHNLCLNVKGKTKEEQLRCTVDLYDQMVRWYSIFLDTPNGRECIEEFDRILPEYKWMSSVKKIDFYLWSIRE